MDQLREHNGRWPKGVSGNPAGRRKTGRLVTELLTEALGREDPDQKDRTYAESLALKLIHMALAGDVIALKTILDRTEGRVPSKIETAIEGGLEIRVVYEDGEAERFDTPELDDDGPATLALERKA